jgi:hypothetical protein
MYVARIKPDPMHDSAAETPVTHVRVKICSSEKFAKKISLPLVVVLKDPSLTI